MIALLTLCEEEGGEEYFTTQQSLSRPSQSSCLILICRIACNLGFVILFNYLLFFFVYYYRGDEVKPVLIWKLVRFIKFNIHGNQYYYY